MDHPNGFGLSQATAQQQLQVAERLVDVTWGKLRPGFVELVRALLAGPLTLTACPQQVSLATQGVL